MAKVVIEVKGVESIMEHLKVATKLEKVRDVVQKNTGDLQKKAVANAQFTKGYSTGATRRSITSEIGDAGLVGRVKAGTHYAVYVENGTRKMEAQPFMKPAKEAIEPQFIADLKRVMK